MTVNRKKLIKIFNKATDDNIDQFETIFNREANNFGIKNKIQEDIFLAQILTEVGADLKPKRESMNYSISGLKRTFRWFRRNPGEAAKEGRSKAHKADQVHIAEHAYDGRLGNKPFPSLDGWRFRGKGMIQLTGRSNYEKIAKKLGWTPEELSTKIDTMEGAVLSALAYWKLNKIHKCTTVDCATKIINKHTNTYALRRSNYNKVSKA